MKKFLYSFVFLTGFTAYVLILNKLGPNNQSPGIIISSNGSTSPINLAAVPNSLNTLGSSASSSKTSAPASTAPSASQNNPQPLASSQKTNPAPSTSQNSTKAPSPAPTPASNPTPAPAPAPQQGLYKNGVYTGSSVDAYYGFVQVKVTVSGGYITDVAFLNYPKDRNTSVAINTQAMPYLISEAIQAQSANVNIVSGATDTSMAFQQSLATALRQAKI